MIDSETLFSLGRLSRITAIAVLLYWCQSIPLKAQGVPINNIIVTDFVSSPDDVLEIDFQDNLPNYPFVLAWIDSTGKQYAQTYKTQSENLIIHIGEFEGWKGTIGLVGLSIGHVDAKFRSVDYNDAWVKFLSTSPLSPASINFSNDYKFKGIAWRWICLGIMMLSSLLIYLYTKRWRLAVILSLFLACASYDIRGGFERWEQLSHISENDWEIAVLTDLQAFIPKAREIIGPNGTWTKERLSGFLNSYCVYELADLTYFPRNTPNHKDADYIITLDPKQREVVLQEGPYYLLRSN